MVNVFVVPQWFFGYDVALELLFSIITLLVALYGFKLYKLCNEKQFKYFGFAFLLIAISYFLQSIINVMIIYDLNTKLMSLMSFQFLYNLTIFEIYIHTLFFVVGLLLLTYNTFKIDNLRVFYLLFIIVMLAIFLSFNKVFMFYLVASVLLLYLVVYYAINYFSTKKTNALIMFIAMTLLLFSTLHFILAVNHGVYYVLGHIFEFIAYLLIASELYLVNRYSKNICAVTHYGKKKR